MSVDAAMLGGEEGQVNARGASARFKNGRIVNQAIYTNTPQLVAGLPLLQAIFSFSSLVADVPLLLGVWGLGHDLLRERTT